MQARRTHSGAGRGPHSKCDEHLRHLVASLRAALSHAEAAAAAEAGASIVAVRASLLAQAEASAAAHSALEELLPRQPATSRAGYLVALHELIPPPAEKTWEDEWVQLGVEEARMQGADEIANETWVRANASVEQTKATYHDVIADFVAEGWPRAQAEAYNLLQARGCGAQFGDSPRKSARNSLSRLRLSRRCRRARRRSRVRSASAIAATPPPRTRLTARSTPKRRASARRRRRCRRRCTATCAASLGWRRSIRDGAGSRSRTRRASSGSRRRLSSPRAATPTASLRWVTR